MATRKKATKAPVRAAVPTRGSRGRTREGAFFPVSPSRAGLPRDYAKTLSAIKRRIQQERLRVVMAANSAMVLLYWDIGRMILDRQKHAGWGARVIDRLAADLREAFANMKGFLPRNLKYMRAFAAAWPDRSIVQKALAQITWYCRKPTPHAAPSGISLGYHTYESFRKVPGDFPLACSNTIQAQTKYRRIARQQRQLFIPCLCNQQTVERIGERAIHMAHGFDMARQDRQHDEALRFELLDQ
jgi:hypothetical protein